ncbi:hypothetical protein N7528_001682 [Penicillium herquei]|nr:hypothetical protein N7528_001682 [Penicillium herquei]
MTVLENTMISDFTVMERAFFLDGREATNHAVYCPVTGITYNYPKPSPIVYQLVTKGIAEQILPEKADAKLRLECLVIQKSNLKYPL